MTAPTQTNHNTQTVDAATSTLVFYDIESLNNLFSVVTLAVDPTTKKATLQVYYLADESAEPGSVNYSAYLNDPAVKQRLTQRIMQANPALMQLGYEITHVLFLDLHVRENIAMLAQMMTITADLHPHEAQSQHYTPGLGQENYTKYQYICYDNTIQQRQFLCSDLPPVLCDTSPEYDPTKRHSAFVAGYNSYNYDTTMLACFFAHCYAAHTNIAVQRQNPDSGYHDQYRDVYVGNVAVKSVLSQSTDTFADGQPTVTPPTAQYMRMINDNLFAQDKSKKSMASFLFNNKLGAHPQKPDRTIAWVMRNNMLKSGRHIDVARFNEVQSRTGLKRHLAQLGHQLLESTKLDGHDSTIATTDELDELLVYNVADVVGLKLLFDHPLYSGSFNQRAALLKTYPECVYKKQSGAYAPDIRPEAVDPWRLTVDSSSAQFVARVLAPYSRLKDIPAVSFDYPHPEVAKELGIEVFNVLDEAEKFFKATVTDPAAQQQFQYVIDYYRSIEGQNFNPTLPGATPENTPLLTNIPKLPNNLPYFHPDGTASTGFVTFSTGGIHGAEYNADRHDNDARAAQAVNLRHQRILDAADHDPLKMKELKSITIDNPITGEKEELKRSQVLDGVSTDNPTWKPKITATIASTPELFKTNNDNATKLNPKYVYTSIGDCIHEDFTSYYPLLLKNMRAFYNADLGEDRYSKIFYEKEYYGKLMKDPNVTDADKATYSVLRNGTKLLLNSASGAGDASHNTNIRMNNRIISMRIIGQLFLWRIGQAQTAAGATIISTNTDGLYSTKLSFERNNEVLAEQEKYIHVDIEPEPLTLVSKDSNNRVEFLPATSDDPHDRIVASAGGALACYNGPNPSKRLKDHAIVQYVLVEYFKQLSLDANPEMRLRDELDRNTVRAILARAHDELPAEKLLMLYQMIVASSPSVGTYLYAVDYVDDKHTATEHTEQVRLEQRRPHTIGKTNRILIVDPDKARSAGCDVYNIGAIKAGTIPKGKTRPDPEPLVEDLFAQVGANKDLLRERKLYTGRYTGLDPASAVIIHNHSLHHPPQGVLQPQQLLALIDTEAYVDIIIGKYDTDWRNTV